MAFTRDIYQNIPLFKCAIYTHVSTRIFFYTLRSFKRTISALVKYAPFINTLQNCEENSKVCRKQIQKCEENEKCEENRFKSVKKMKFVKKIDRFLHAFISGLAPLACSARFSKEEKCCDLLSPIMWFFLGGEIQLHFGVAQEGI